MGVSSKLVSSDVGINWKQVSQDFLKNGVLMENPKPKNQQQQQRLHMTPLECPRCHSTNTKFCYYNNYSRLQPRHYCKACRRHWTEGGTLRNVPVGGGRKPKRAKTTHTSTTNPTNGTTSIVDNEAMTTLPQLHHLPIPFGATSESRIFPDVLRRVLLQPSQSLPSEYGMNGSGSNYIGPLASPLFPTQFAAFEPAVTTTYDPFSIASYSSSLVSEDLASVKALGASWQALPELPLSTADIGTLDARSSYWSCWDNDIIGHVEPQPTHTSPADS